MINSSIFLNTENSGVYDPTLLPLTINQTSSALNIQNINYERPLPPLRVTSESNLIIKNSNDQYVCCICGISFSNNDEMNNHLLSHNITYNAQSNSYLNPQSNIQLNNLLNPQLNALFNNCQLNSESNSLQISTVKQTFDCKVCGYPLRTVNVYENNMNILINHTDQNLDKTIDMKVCDNCGKEYPINNQIFKFDTIPNNLIKNEKQNIIFERYFCQLCDKSYKHNRDLRKHEKMVHGLKISQLSKIKRKKNKNEENEINSEKKSDSIKCIEKPINSNTKFVCEKCTKSFRGPFELRRHVMTVHDNNKPFKCPTCGKYFRDAYEIKRHNSSTHRNTFSLEYLDDDIASNVTNYSINCVSQATFTGIEENSTTFLNENNLMVPKLINTEFYCGICDKNFRGPNEFKRHYSVVHEKKYRYKCVHCGKLWRDQYDLKRHCKRSHFLDQDIDKAFIRQCLLENHHIVSKSSISPNLRNKKSNKSQQFNDTNTFVQNNCDQVKN